MENRGSSPLPIRRRRRRRRALLYPLLVSTLLLQVAMAADDLPPGAPPPTRRTPPPPPAVIVFGDSIVDPGNNNAIETLVRCNFPPYGQDFVAHKPTGRFSNGRIPSDLIGTHTIKNLGTELSDEDLLTGVSFASGGAGYDPLTGRLVSALTMDDQLDLFKEYKKKLVAIAGTERAATIVSKSLYMVITGTDDIANTYFGTPFRRAEFDLPDYLNFTVGCASSFYKVSHLPSIMLPAGFEESSRGCCGTGYFEVTLACNNLTTSACKDASKYVFWDSYHPTERAYEILIRRILQEYGSLLIN